MAFVRNAKIPIANLVKILRQTIPDLANAEIKHKRESHKNRKSNVSADIIR